MQEALKHCADMIWKTENTGSIHEYTTYTDESALNVKHIYTRGHIRLTITKNTGNIYKIAQTQFSHLLYTITTFTHEQREHISLKRVYDPF